MTSGVLAGFPVVDIHVELNDGKFHDEIFLPCSSVNECAREIVKYSYVWESFCRRLKNAVSQIRTVEKHRSSRK